MDKNTIKGIIEAVSHTIHTLVTLVILLLEKEAKPCSCEGRNPALKKQFDEKSFFIEIKARFQ